jgi:hypothetical protein
MFQGLAGLSLVSCVSTYQPPAPSEPHAEVDVVRTYEAPEGTLLEERATFDRDLAFSSSTPVPMADGPRTDRLVVHPGFRRLRVSGAFSTQREGSARVERRGRPPALMADIETYDCGTEGERRSCVRAVALPVPRQYETVPTTGPVVLRACADEVPFLAEAGHMYVVAFTFRRDETCAVTCREQMGNAGGIPELRGCRER